MKMTKLGVGHFTIISGHFFTNYNYRFHKTEILMVILKGLTCQNLKRIKSYDTNHKFICNWKFTSHKWPTEIQTVILRCLSRVFLLCQLIFWHFFVNYSTVYCKYLFFIQDFFYRLKPKQYKKCQYSWLFKKKKTSGNL